MKKQMLNDPLCKVTKMKRTCMPYAFLKVFFKKTTGVSKEILTVSDLLQCSPTEIRLHLKTNTEERMIRKGLETEIGRAHV